MPRDKVANWHERAMLVSNEPFNSREALQLVKEIENSVSESSAGYRAYQAGQILKGIRAKSEPSAQQLMDAKAAINTLGKALEKLKLQ
jgi:hypothetical protein